MLWVLALILLLYNDITSTRSIMKVVFLIEGYGTSVNNLAANCKLYEDNGIDSEIYRAWGFLERSRALQKETGGKT